LKIDFSGFGKYKPTTGFKERPFFLDLKPDINHIKEFAQDYQKYKKIIIIGNGGAVNSFLVLYKALYKGDKEVEIINSMEPDLINYIKKRYNKHDTLVITSSTSGTNVGVLEIMSQFLKYNMVIITAENDGALRMIAERLNIPTLFVPHITDRFLTSGALAYFPLILLDIDVDTIDMTLHKAYEKYSKEGNDALVLSSILKNLEDEGYTEVFLPIYSYWLEGFEIYITQLMHESVSKDGKGQNFLIVPAPESQHHTNQRFFGGRKNVCAIFLTAGQDDKGTEVSLPENLNNISLRDGDIGNINNVKLAKSFEFEFLGTYNNAIEDNIPSAIITLEKIDEKSIAELISFWHYVSVYSSWLRHVNPFDQPQVEKSKEIAFQMRKET